MYRQNRLENKNTESDTDRERHGLKNHRIDLQEKCTSCSGRDRWGNRRRPDLQTNKQMEVLCEEDSREGKNNNNNNHKYTLF